MAEPYDGIVEGLDDLGWPTIIMIIAYAAVVVVVTAPFNWVSSLRRRGTTHPV